MVWGQEPKPDPTRIAREVRKRITPPMTTADREAALTLLDRLIGA